MKKVLRNIQMAYYAIYIAAIAAAASGYALMNSDLRIDPQSEAGIAINSMLIVLIIGAVPLSLWLFSRNTKKWAQLADVHEKLAKYQKGAIIRLLVMGVGLVLGVIFFYVLGLQSMIFCAGISAIGVFFCKPAEVKIVAELELEDYPD